MLSILRCIVIFGILCLVLGGKEKTSRSSRRNPTENSEEFPRRSLADWKRQPKETLVLMCNQLSLVSSGSSAVLAGRIYQHYQHVLPPHQQPSGNVNFTNNLVGNDEQHNEFPIDTIQNMIRDELANFVLQFNLQPQQNQSHAALQSAAINFQQQQQHPRNVANN